MAISTVERTNPDMLRVTLSDGVILWVPTDINNSDYQSVLEWENSGGVITDL